MLGRVREPIVATILRLALSAAQIAFQLFGIGVIFVACALIACVVYTHFHLVIPAIFPVASVGFWVSMAIGLWASTGVWLNYLGSLGCSPGIVPSGSRMPGMPELVTPPSSTGYKARPCTTCNAHKPPRAHHCSLCGKCVMKMDHHCPWINSCVGYHNQRYFLSFLCYLLVGTAICGGYILYIASSPQHYPIEVTGHNMLFLSGIVCASLHLAMWFFVGWNMHLALSNQTAVEFQINMYEAGRAKARGEAYRNPYDLGRWGNFVDLFGTKADTFAYYTIGPPAAVPVRYTRSKWLPHPKTIASFAGFAFRRTCCVIYLSWPCVQSMALDGRYYRSWRGSTGQEVV